MLSDAFLTFPLQCLPVDSTLQSFWGTLTKSGFPESDGMAEWGEINFDLG